MTNRDDLFKKFYKFLYIEAGIFMDSDSDVEQVFGWIYSEIEARDRRFNELLSLWNPVDEYVRPLTPLGHSVSAKALELVKSVAPSEEVKQGEKQKVYLVMTKQLLIVGCFSTEEKANKYAEGSNVMVQEVEVF